MSLDGAFIGHWCPIVTYDYGSTMGENDWLVEVNARIEEVATAGEPYDAVGEVIAYVNEPMIESWLANELWFVWIELEDDFELRPEERVETIAEMRRASREWVEARGDAEALHAYLNEWNVQRHGLKGLIYRWRARRAFTDEEWATLATLG
jgi:hypothetical protein